MSYTGISTLYHWGVSLITPSKTLKLLAMIWAARGVLTSMTIMCGIQSFKERRDGAVCLGFAIFTAIIAAYYVGTLLGFGFIWDINVFSISHLEDQEILFVIDQAAMWLFTFILLGVQGIRTGNYGTYITIFHDFLSIFPGLISWGIHFANGVKGKELDASDIHALYTHQYFITAFQIWVIDRINCIENGK